MKVLSIVGARPQFIKAAAVSRELRRRATEVLVHTGQHYDDEMSAVFFRDLGIPQPEHSLDVGSGSHGEQTGAMLARVEAVIRDERPDWVLVYGDTNSTLAGALAAAKLHVPVAHVEAGLRSFNRRMPEEVNRVVTDHLSALLLCPSEVAASNLADEGIRAGVHVVGDVMADVLLDVAARVRETSAVLTRLGLEEGGYALATVHRAENTDAPERLQAIVDALASLPFPVVFPVHPRTRGALARLPRAPGARLRRIDPVGYGDMVRLLADARVTLTDSGGLQKEAYWLGVPCVTLRDETEWVETVASGWNRLVGADRDRIVAAASAAARPVERPLLYGGDGAAAARVVARLEDATGPV